MRLSLALVFISMLLALKGTLQLTTSNNNNNNNNLKKKNNNSTKLFTGAQNTPKENNNNKNDTPTTPTLKPSLTIDATEETNSHVVPAQAADYNVLSDPTPTVTTTNSSPPLPVQYHCPNVLPRAQNADAHQEQWYNAASRAILLANSTASTATAVQDFMSIFRQAEFDNWGHSYEEVKRGMTPWKSSRRFADFLTNHSPNATIYESACGIGLNLYMTLEILQQAHGLEGLTVYGNEYVPESVQVARAIWGNPQLVPAQARLGQICSADSTNLSFVPSNAFDLVYTGYISPLLDPLHWNLTNIDDSYTKYVQVCEDASLTALRDEAQNRQNAWYAAWVREMVRIAKPGAPILIEQVSYPFCEAYFDWGGVSRRFWHAAYRREHHHHNNNSNNKDDELEDWRNEIDEEATEMVDDILFRKRYHVFLRKKRVLPS